MTLSKWIAATKIHRLIQCSASGVFSNPDVSSTAKRSPAATDIGSIAHRALERWTREALWKGDEFGDLLRHEYELEGFKSSKDVNMQPGGRLLGIRIKKLGKSLRERLALVRPDEIFPEQAAADDLSRIHGVIDLLIVEDNAVHVYDYKTGRRALTEDNQVSAAVRTQLMAYGILASHLFPNRELDLAVVSPSRGIIEVPFDAALATRIESHVREFCLAGDVRRDLMASPSVDGCRYCPRRSRCEPQWQMALSEGWADVVEGDVVNFRRADNGQLAIAVRTDDGVSWVLNVPPKDAQALEEGLPLRLRGVRLNRVRSEGATDVHFRSNADSEVTMYVPRPVQLPARPGLEEKRG